MSDVREITIGETTYRITRFRGLKAALAGALVSRVMREVPELQERIVKFRKEFRENNSTIVTPGMAKLPRFAPLGLTAEDFEAAGGKIEFPEEPETATVMVHIFPDLFDLANVELRRFLAIIAMPNRELEDADDADEVDEALLRFGKRLFREGDIDELLELVSVGLEVLQDQILSKRERLGKLRGLPFLSTLLSTTETQEQDESNPTTPESTPSPSSAPSSSTDLPTDLDGIEEPRSMVSPGTN